MQLSCGFSQASLNTIEQSDLTFCPSEEGRENCGCEARMNSLQSPWFVSFDRNLHRRGFDDCFVNDAAPSLGMRALRVTVNRLAAPLSDADQRSGDDDNTDERIRNFNFESKTEIGQLLMEISSPASVTTNPVCESTATAAAMVANYFRCVMMSFLNPMSGVFEWISVANLRA